MTNISDEQLKEIAQKIEKEFPNDPALQQVHIARKIIDLEATLAGMDFWYYVKSQTNKTEKTNIR
jgi:hypothetical protein